MQGLGNLPLVGRTGDVQGVDAIEYWRSVFGGIWGPVELTEVGEHRLSGSLRSRRIADLTFNQITWGNQIFECVNRESQDLDEPFYSLTFPQSGSAECFVGRTRMRLTPNNAYLINVNSTAKLRVDKSYTTVNIQIPVSSMQDRLGRGVEILPRGVMRHDPIYHMTRELMAEITQFADQADPDTTQFLTRQLLDTIAFFLNGAKESAQESLAVKAVRARVLRYIDGNYPRVDLSPAIIAKECGISRSYLYKVFVDQPSVMAHVRRRRIEAACSMIQVHRKGVSLTTVAMACGFSSSSEFSRLFKKEVGVKPSEYRD